MLLICYIFWATLVNSIPIVDLEYSIYEGILDLEHDISIFKG